MYGSFELNVFTEGFANPKELKKYYQDLLAQEENLVIENTTFHNLPAVKISYSSVSGLYASEIIAFITEDYTYEIEYNALMKTENKEDLNKILSSFEFTNREIINISIWPEVNSFDISEKSFEGKIWNDKDKIEIITTESTIFYRSSGPDFERIYLTFSELYSILNNWEGPPWPFKVKGFLKEEGIIKATEVFYITQ